MFKVCKCCNAQVGPRKRVCPTCKVPALWREPTREEVEAHEAHDRKMNEVLQSLLEG